MIFFNKNGKFKYLTTNIRGSSLIQMLILLLVISIMAGAIATRISNQKKEFIKLKDKFHKKDLEYVISEKIKLKSFCDCLFKNASINNNKIDLGEDFIIPSGFDSSCSAVNGSEDILPGSLYTDSQLIVEEIKTEGLSLTIIDTYRSRLVIRLKSENQNLQIAPISQEILIKEGAYDAVLNKRPLTCVYAYNTQSPNSWCGSGTQGSRRNDRYPHLCFGHNPRYSCPAGYYQAFYREADYVYFYTCVKI
ncbi:MAG: hypothetical protein ACK4VO_07150 [Pseudobdellovibrio sp.]